MLSVELNCSLLVHIYCMFSFLQLDAVNCLKLPSRLWKDQSTNMQLVHMFVFLALPVTSCLVIQLFNALHQENSQNQGFSVLVRRV